MNAVARFTKANAFPPGIAPLFNITSNRRKRVWGTVSPVEILITFFFSTFCTSAHSSIKDSAVPSAEGEWRNPTLASWDQYIPFFSLWFNTRVRWNIYSLFLNAKVKTLCRFVVVALGRNNVENWASSQPVLLGIGRHYSHYHHRLFDFGIFLLCSRNTTTFVPPLQLYFRTRATAAGMMIFAPNNNLSACAVDCIAAAECFATPRRCCYASISATPGKMSTSVRFQMTRSSHTVQISTDRA